MKTQGGLLQTLMVVGLTAGLVYVPLSRRLPESSAAPESMVVPAGTGERAGTARESPTLTGGAGPRTDETRDALSLLAEFFNLDISSATLRRVIGDALDAFGTTSAQARVTVLGLAGSTGGAMQPVARAEAAATLRRLLAAAALLPGPVAGALSALTDCSEAHDGSAGTDCSPGALAVAAERVRAYLEGADIRPSIEVPFRSELRSPTQDALALGVVRAETLDAGYSVRFIVATLADPCDSYTGTAFDPTLESLRRALESDRYVLDRFFLPDWTPPVSADRGRTQCTGKLHERHPGVVLFRREATRSLLVLFTVPETPTLGIHPAAFVRAVRLITRWENAGSPGEVGAAGPRGVVRVVGPSFSGSSASLARTLASLPDGFAAGFDFELVSGSATSARNLEELNLPAGPGHGTVRFAAATLPDPVLTCALNAFLARMGITSGETALLVESNTAYGSDLRETRRRPDAAGGADPGARADVLAACPEGLDKGDAGAPARRDPLEVPFPLHISRVRSTREPQGAGMTSRLAVPDARPLELEEAQPPADLLPPMRPELTAPTVELVLRSLLQTIRHEQWRAVGVLATDVRDKLFLTREVRRRAPDATVFTSEADILYTHPSFAPYTRGMVVVSTYPTFDRNQAWTSGAQGNRGRLQFSSMAAQGTYNATLLHLRAMEREAGVADADVRLPLAEYTMPFSAIGSGELRPPVWISVVGRTRLWPVRTYESNSALTRAYTRAAASLMPQSPSRGGLAASPTSVLLFGLLTLVAWCHVAAYLLPPAITGRWTYFRRFRSRDEPMPPAFEALRGAGELRRNDELDRARSLLACFTTLALLYGFLSALCWTWVVFGAGGWRGLPVGAAAVVTLAALSSLTLLVAGRALRALPRLGAIREQSAGVRLSRYVHRIGVATLASGAVWYGAAYVASAWPKRLLPSTPRPDELWHVFLFERATTLTSGVSPIWTLLAFTLAGYLWGAARLRRIGIAHDVRMSDRLLVLARLTSAHRAPARGAAFPLVLAGVLLLVIAACCLLLVPNWPATVEGPAFNAMIFWTVVLLQVLIASAIARLIHFRRVIQDHLERFVGQPIVEAYGRLPGDVVTASTFIRPPRLTDAEILVRRWQTLPGRFERLIEDAPLADTEVEGPPAGAPVTAEAVPVPIVRVVADRRPVLATNLPAVFADERASRPGMAWNESRTRVFARMATLQLLDRLQLARALAASVEATGPRGPARTWLIECRAWIATAEECVAIQLLLSLREAFSRLAGTAVFIMVASFLLLAGHTLFPMQPRQTLLGMTWANIGIAIVVGLSGLAAIDRNGVLSDITHTPRGAINWDWALMRRVLLYAVLPLLSVLTVQFPEIGAALFQWVEPVQRALL